MFKKLQGYIDKLLEDRYEEKLLAMSYESNYEDYKEIKNDK